MGDTPKFGVDYDYNMQMDTRKQISLTTFTFGGQPTTLPNLVFLIVT